MKLGLRKAVALGMSMMTFVIVTESAHADTKPQKDLPNVPLTLHESTNESENNTGSCVQPAGYTYDDVNGVVDCTPVLRKTCTWVMVCYYRRTKSCFPGETKIQMADGSAKAIEEIRSGDMVWNPMRKAAEKVGKLLKGPEKIPLWEIRFGAFVVHTTQKHPMIVKANNQQGFEVRRAKEVTTHDEVLGADGKFHAVDAVVELPLKEGQLVYNFEVVTESADVRDRMISAAGFVTGDVVVQADLNGDKLPWKE